MSRASIRVLDPLIVSLREVGIDPGEVLRDARAVAPASGPQRLPKAVMCRVCQLAVEQTGDTGFALKAGLSSSPGTLGVLGYVMQNSATIGIA